ncbi:hypothetical protein [Endozoicomonas numazuensis]|nr:hypothetical protein [Endozoicomonas numazuensis]
MSCIFLHSFYVLVATCLLLVLTCQGQFANASGQPQPDFETIENTVLVYLFEEKTPWLEDLKAATSNNTDK